MYKILVVDDVIANRKLLRQMLSVVMDCEIYDAIDGKEAIDVFKQKNPDLILMDINMPIMDGYESAAQIKTLTGDDYVPIIFVTALSETTLSNALASGGDDFISKPFDVEVLKSKINAHLRIRQLNILLNDKNRHLMHEQELIEYFFEAALKKSFIDDSFIKFNMTPMSTFNGDLLLVERGLNGGIYVVMGDFTGHGLSAAMGTIPVAMIFFKMVSKGAAVSDIAREINNQLHKLMPTGMFFSASIIELNSNADVMTLWMGGMPDIYFIGSCGELKNIVNSQHMPLGILSDKSFDEETRVFNVDIKDKVYLYSDGVIESNNSTGEMFGNDRLKDVLVTHADDRFNQVLNELKRFTGISHQSDDITLVELTCNKIPAIENAENVYLNDFLLPWKLSVLLNANDMREHDPVSKVSDMLGSFPALARHKGVLNMLLTEMYTNSLDHSILELKSIIKTADDEFDSYYKNREKKLNLLDNASIEFCFVFDHVKRCLKIIIKDSGIGYINKKSTHNDDMLYGRGLNIIAGFSENISFSDDGKELEVIYCL